MKRRALIIDDDRIPLMVLERILKVLGFDVIVHTDLFEGIQAARDLTERDVIFLDIIVDTGLSGLDVLDKRQRGEWDFLSKIPIIVVSGRTDREAIKSALTKGATSYVIKPFSKKIIAQRIEELFPEDAR